MLNVARKQVMLQKAQHYVSLTVIFYIFQRIQLRDDISNQDHCVLMPADPFKSTFLRTHKFGNIGVLPKFVFSFLLYLHHMMLVNVKFVVIGHKMIMFQGCRLHWFD